MTRLISIFAFVAFLAIATSVKAEIYSWRGEDGSMHLTETAPPRSCKTQDCKEIHSTIDRVQRERDQEQQRIREKEAAEKIRVQEAANARNLEASRVAKAKEEKLEEAYKSGYRQGDLALEGEYRHLPSKAYKVCRYNALTDMRDEATRNYYRDYFRDREVSEAYSKGCLKATSKRY